MANYRSYEHVERIDRDEVEGILDGKVVVQSKLDGSNALVYNKDGELFCGSRKRELTEEEDNANFYKYISTSKDIEVAALRSFVMDNPNYIVYGEFLGVPGQRLLGSIKRYLDSGFYIFDVFDINTGEYLPYEQWSTMVGKFYHRIVPVIATFDHPTQEQIEACLEECGFNLPDGVLGEGIVIKQEPAFRDKWGHIATAKIVRNEYKQEKSKPKKVFAPGKFEEEFVDKYVTDAFLDKCQNKVLQACSDDVFDYKNKKHMGMFVNLIVSDSISENVWDFVKKKKFPTINFGTLKGLICIRGREFLGL